MSERETDEYRNGAAYAAAHLRSYGLTLGSRDVLMLATTNADGTLTAAWLSGALDTTISATLSARADGRLI